MHNSTKRKRGKNHSYALSNKQKYSSSSEREREWARECEIKWRKTLNTQVCFHFNAVIWHLLCGWVRGRRCSGGVKLCFIVMRSPPASLCLADSHSPSCCLYEYPPKCWVVREIKACVRAQTKTKTQTCYVTRI